MLPAIPAPRAKLELPERPELPARLELLVRLDLLERLDLQVLLETLAIQVQPVQLVKQGQREPLVQLALSRHQHLVVCSIMLIK